MISTETLSTHTYPGQTYIFQDIFRLTNCRETVVGLIVDTFSPEQKSSTEAQEQLLRWFFKTGTVDRTVGDTEAAFHTETGREDRRIRTLMYETDIPCFAGQHADHVVAFEPHERTATRLRENAEFNDIHVTVYQRAVADYEGTASLVHPRRSPREL